MNPTTIERQFCIPYQELIGQNFLADYIQTGFDKFKFLMTIVTSALQTRGTQADRFNPDPTVYLRHMYGDNLVAEDLTAFKDILLRSRNGKNFFENLAFLFIENKINDEKFARISRNIQSIEKPEIFLKLLYFFVSSNKMSFNKLSESGGVQSWMVQNDFEKEQSFASIPGNQKMLFHGTSQTSVYSIMRNGLRSMSGTSLMSAGAAYGNGIYLAEDPTTSLGYCRSGHDVLGQLNGDSHGSNYSYIYMFVLKCKNLNHKGGVCYVQQNNDVIICGLLAIPSHLNLCGGGDLVPLLVQKGTIMYNTYKIESAIPSKPVKEITVEDESRLTMRLSKTEPSSTQAIVTAKRFMKEMQVLMDPKKRNEVIRRINFYNPEDWTTPLLMELSPPDDCPLYADCQKYGVKGIVVAFYFTGGGSDGYPYTAPKIRVVYPKFVPKTGRITEGGSICMDAVYKNGWSPANSLEGLALSIINLVSYEGQGVSVEESVGRIDPNRLGQQYTYDEFISSFSVVASLHTWAK